ncbi:MAG: hypothetical protein Q4F05_10720 [bacterium]|nr:hypothetical protein [bacterium]
MKNEKKNHLICIAVSIMVSVLMVLVAEVSGEKEILFPEIVALTTGAIACKRQPWIVSKWQLVCLMTISAILGIAMNRMLPIPLFGKIILAYAVVGTSLIVTGCSLAPMISACILPLFMGTTSIVYPIAVSILCIIIVVLQFLLERAGMREYRPYEKPTIPYRQQFLHWSVLLVLVAASSILPVYTGYLFFVAPPLLVLFTEFANVDAAPRKAPFMIFLVTGLGAFTGVLCRYIICVRFGMHLTVAALVAAILINIMFAITKKPFPPAGAITFLPFIIPESNLLAYPFQVCAGTSILIAMALYIFREQEDEKSKDLFVKEG